MQLCIDFGNTRIKAAIFQERLLKESFTIEYEDAIQQLDAIIDTFHPEEGNYSSVKSLGVELKSWLHQQRIQEILLIACTCFDGHSLSHGKI